MRPYTSTDGYNETVDLDDISIYPQKWREMNVHDLFTKCEETAGHSLFYMDFLHAGFGYGTQRERVATLCKELSDIWNFTRQFEPNAHKCTLLNEDEYRLALMNWLWRFRDETENQC